ncbi:MAG: hypothetical protein R3C15_18990 [Thermoleophilia bacterium]
MARRHSSLLRGLVAAIGILYVGSLIGFTVGFAGDVPVGGWIGFGVVAAVVSVLSIGAIVLLERVEDEAGTDRAVPLPLPVDGRHRVLVVADVGCAAGDACPAIVSHLPAGGAEVLVVAPSVVSPLHRLTDDDARERAAAGRRLDEVLAALAGRGVRARGLVGAETPLEAIEDALAAFPADEIVVLAPPTAQARWSEVDLVERARIAFGRPVTHVAVGAG